MIDVCRNPHHGRANPKPYAFGLCQSCWKRLRDRGTLLPAQGVFVACALDGCNRPHLALGYCKRHYRAFRIYGDPSCVREWGRTGCRIEGCKRPHCALGLCSKHYSEMRRDRAAIIAETTADFRESRVPGEPVREFIEIQRAKGWALTEISARCGITTRTLDRIANGRQKSVEARTADAIATAFHRHPDELFGVAS